MQIAKKLGTIGTALALTLALYTPALAGLCGFWIFPDCPTTNPPPSSVPEIDPNLLRGAAAVLAGGVMMLAGRRRAR